MSNGNMHEPILEVIIGCMFSGKTEELARRIRRLQHASKLEDWTQSYLVAVPKTAARLDRGIGKLLKKRGVHRLNDPAEIFEILMPEQRVVAFDEAQFFSPNLIEVAERLVRVEQRRVIISGLNVDFMARPWETMTPIICRAEDIYLCLAVCAACGKNRAVRSQRLSFSTNLNDSGKKERYEARCLACFEPPTD